MPVYDYLCTACDHRADILHGINDPGPNFCPSCGAEGVMRKQFAAPAVHFKGSGWAKKDRGGSSGATRASSKSGSEDGAREARGSSERSSAADGQSKSEGSKSEGPKSEGSKSDTSTSSGTND